ncbi:hypothetical protein J6590_035532 [Homalodisca vitripennis]|nr:hypothetical protein J6590_035532 [Homalodisca vitripennis]
MPGYAYPHRARHVCRPSYGERIASQFSTCKSTHVRTDTKTVVAAPSPMSELQGLKV